MESKIPTKIKSFEYALFDFKGDFTFTGMFVLAVPTLSEHVSFLPDDSEELLLDTMRRVIEEQEAYRRANNFYD